MKTLNIDIGEGHVDINGAMNLAKERAALELGVAQEDLVIVSWYDCRADRHSPTLTSGWEDYGRSHGATLRLEINEGEYVFLCEDSGLH
jgi:hypothetical protein